MHCRVFKLLMLMAAVLLAPLVSVVVFVSLLFVSVCLLSLWCSVVVFVVVAVVLHVFCVFVGIANFVG